MGKKTTPVAKRGRAPKKRRATASTSSPTRDFDPGLDFEAANKIVKNLIEDNIDWLKYIAKR